MFTVKAIVADDLLRISVSPNFYPVNDNIRNLVIADKEKCLEVKYYVREAMRYHDTGYERVWSDVKRIKEWVRTGENKPSNPLSIALNDVIKMSAKEIRERRKKLFAPLSHSLRSIIKSKGDLKDLVTDPYDKTRLRNLTHTFSKNSNDCVIDELKNWNGMFSNDIILYHLDNITRYKEIMDIIDEKKLIYLVHPSLLSKCADMLKH